MNDKELTGFREQIIEYSKKMAKDRLVQGTLGNISVLVDEGLIAITPSGIDYDKMVPEDVPIVDFDGNVVKGKIKPSSETPMHIAIYKQCSRVHAIVHTHSPYATAFSIIGKPIPPVHYIVGKIGGEEIPITDSYELYGTDKLAEVAVKALGEQYKGVLLRNHGDIAVGNSLGKAYSIAIDIESMAEVAYLSMTLGNPILLTKPQMQESITKFKGYGQTKQKL